MNLAEYIIERTCPEPNSGCWLWMGATNAYGYGSFTREQRRYIASRASWQAFRGELPAGMLVCHTCDTPACCNPAHLFVGDKQANADDMVRKGRAPRGPEKSLDVCVECARAPRPGDTLAVRKPPMCRRCYLRRSRAGAN